MTEAQIVKCCFCGKDFKPWDDGISGLNDSACRSCDDSYEDGMLFDRELGDS